MTYYKIINDRQVFSTCTTIQMPDGTWISNPSNEQIELAGWIQYVPPTPEPYVQEPQMEPDYEDIIKAIKRMLSTEVAELSDEDALEVAALYPTWNSMINEPVTSGTRLWYDGKLYKVIQSHTVQDEWTPDITHALYSEISIEEIPEWVQPIGAETVYHIGDKVKHNGYTWECVVDNNSWEPGVYGWIETI